MLFDRRGDISKLKGCYTRNVAYRWSIFQEALEKIDSRGGSVKALDFGAGSLRDSFEMASRGYAVTAYDMDKASLQRYFQSYNWGGVQVLPEIITGPLDQLSGRTFDVITAFDVIEHVEEARPYLQMFHSLLKDDGIILITVPNGRSILETYSSLRKEYAQYLIKIGKVPFGAAHLQFNSPQEWKNNFLAAGFKVQAHDMALGFLVNDLFYGIIGTPLRLVILPVMEKLAAYLKISFNPQAFENIFYSPWLMAEVNKFDQWLKPLFNNHFGWCLFVLQKI